MTREYISREAAIEQFEDSTSAIPEKLARIRIEEIPAADVVEVRHGRWERFYDKSAGGPRLRCSLCRSRSLYAFYYCPDCGAKMDGGQDE